MSNRATGGEAFGTLLRGHRAVAGLTQEELAELAGLSVRAVANWERGRARPRRRSVALLADALALSIKERKRFTQAARAEPAAGTAAMPELGTGSQPAPEVPLQPADAVPRQLPAGPAHFVGRQRELSLLTRWLEAGTAAGQTVILAIGGTAERFPDPEQARAWLQAEYPALLAATAAAADGGFDTHAWQLPAVLREHFDRRGYYADWAECQRLALAAADRLGDHAAQALAHRILGQVLIQLRRLDDARSHLREALKLALRHGDQAGQGFCHFQIARIFESQDDFSRALSHHQQSLRLWRAAGDLTGQAHALNAVGWDNAQLGNYQRALSYCGKALRLHRTAGNRLGEAATLDSLGYCCHRAGRYAQAVAYYQQALPAYADVGDRYLRAQTLIHLGETHQANGDQEATRDFWQQALAILSDLHHPDAAPIRANLHDLTAAPTPLPRD